MLGVANGNLETKGLAYQAIQAIYICVCVVVAFSCLLAVLGFSCVGVPGMGLKQDGSVLR
jgi:hypothetical protein